MRVIIALLIGFVLICGCRQNQRDNSTFTIAVATQLETAAWKSLPQRLQKIIPPTFVQQDFYVAQFGAQNSFDIDSRSAIQQAIDHCHQQGGGRVVLPAGNYFSNGPLHLKSEVNLHLQSGATLRFGDDPQHYLPLVKVRWEGTVCWNWSPLIYAFRQSNIGLTGAGTIDGNGKRWSTKWRKLQDPEKARLRQMGNDLVPEDQRVFGNGFLDLDEDGEDDGFGDNTVHYLRPTLVEFYECKNILIDSLSFRQPPFWTIHPVFCKNVSIRNLQVYGDYLNDDGIDPDSCEDVLIENCYVETHDDAIAIKAGRDQDAWERSGSRNIIVRNCQLASGVNAFAIGSEMSGGVEDVFVENCQLLRGRHGLNFKCNLDRGGQVQNIFLRNILVDTLRDAMFIFRMDYHGYRGNQFPTKFNDFYASNIRCTAVEKTAFKIVGVKSQPIERILLRDIKIDRAETDMELNYCNDLVIDDVRVAGKIPKPQ